MPRKPANPKTDTAKRTTRKKKAAVEAVAETAPVIAEPIAETVTEAPVAETPEKKTRKPRAKKADKKAEPVLITTLQLGNAEFDISDIAAKAYKASKSLETAENTAMISKR